jgi:hypothetical protein
LAALGRGRDGLRGTVRPFGDTRARAERDEGIQEPKRMHVVIVGGGFADVACAKLLAEEDRSG